MEAETNQYILDQAASIIDAEAFLIEHPVLRIKKRLWEIGKATLNSLRYADADFAGNAYIGAWYVDRDYSANS